MMKDKLRTFMLLALFAIYFIALFKITLSQSSTERRLNLEPFVTIGENLQSISSGNIIGILMGTFQLLGNVLMFVPFGYMTAVLFPKMRKLTRIFPLTLALSLLIEICQYIFICGSADIDDLLLNILGAMVGFGVYGLISQLYEPKKYALLISVLMIAVTCTGFYARNNFKFLLPNPVINTGSNQTPNQPPKVNLKTSINLNSSNAFLVQLNTGENILNKNGNDRIYPASMTKIMTAIVALENIRDLDVSITLSEKMFADIYNSNSSVAGFLPGEKLRAVDLLYGLMLPSGAECAKGLAEYVSRTESAFVDLMNKKAHHLGMNDTHFTNAAGLHNSNHYSTAKDIAALVEYAIKNDTFLKIFGAKKYSTKPTNRHEDGVTFYSTLFSKMKSTDVGGARLLGGKTGYTSEAGQCLASFVEKDGKRYILVTCGAPGDNQTQQLHIDDAFRIFSELDSIGIA